MIFNHDGTVVETLSLWLMFDVLSPARRKQLQDWKSKVVVDNIHFRSIIPSNKASNIERTKGLLKDEPRTVALKKTHVLPPPVSMYLSSRWKPNEARTILLRKDRPEQFFDGEQQGFSRFVSRDRTAIHKRGHNDGWGPETPD